MKTKEVVFSFIMSTCISFNNTAQDGTAGDPYTALGHAWHVPSSGTYYFDVGGTAFSTYVEAGSGWILVASGSDATDEAGVGYSTATNLALQSDQILSSSVYTSSLVTDVRINGASGPNLPFDVQSSAAAVLSNLQNDVTLSVGTNSGDWTGTGTGFLSRSCASLSGSLSVYIYHACGSSSGMHWLAGYSTCMEQIDLSNPTKNGLNLWVRAATVPLPIELLNFNVQAADNETVHISWQTFSETKNDFFTVERSTDARTWEFADKIEGAGNSSVPVSYNVVDKNPYYGTSYYRLKQTDFDGQYTYSQIRSVSLQGTIFRLYPNPTNSLITLEGGSQELPPVKLFNMWGDEITDLVPTTDAGNSKIIFDLSGLVQGVYLFKIAGNSSMVVYKQ